MVRSSFAVMHSYGLLTRRRVAYENLGRAKRARLDATEAMVTDAQSGYRYMQRGVATTSRNAELMTGSVSTEVRSRRYRSSRGFLTTVQSAGLSKVQETFRTAASNHLSEIYQT